MMETTYCEKCGLLHDQDDGECLGCEMVTQITSLRAINKKLEAKLELAEQDYKQLAMSERIRL